MQPQNHSHKSLRPDGWNKIEWQKSLLWLRPRNHKKATATPGPSPAPNAPHDQPSVAARLVSPPVHSPPVVTVPHVFGTFSTWRLSPVTYLSNRRPDNPGLLALTRGGAGGLFSVRNVDNGKQYAMEVLHLPSLSSIEYMHAFKKLKVLQSMQNSLISCFVLQLPPLLPQPIWWSSATLYVHIVTEYHPQTLQDWRGHSELIGNEPVLGHIIWELLSGLSHLHDRGIIHCNLEPENVLITSRGHCVITGFGGSFLVQDQTRPLRYSLEAVHKDQIIITPGFSAPELWTPWNGIFEFDETVDSWSLGLIICSLLVPRIDYDVQVPSEVPTTVHQHYTSSRLTPEDISLQMWMACCPNAVTEFVSMLCQLNKRRLQINDAQGIAAKHGWDRLGAPFPSQIVPLAREPPIPNAHRKLDPFERAVSSEKIETAMNCLDLDIPDNDNAFVPNLDFKPFR